MSASDDYPYLTLRPASPVARADAALLALAEIDWLRAELNQVRYALSADSVLEMVTRLSGAADFYDPGDDYLLNAARVIAESMVP